MKDADSTATDCTGSASNGPDPAGPGRGPVRASQKGRTDRTVLLSVIAFAALFWLLREAFVVVMPVVFALLLTLAVWPVAEAIRSRTPAALHWLGAGAAFLLVVVLLALFLFGLGLCVQQLYDLMQKIGPGLNDALPGGSLRDRLPDLSSGDLSSLATRDNVLSTFMSALDATTSTLGGVLLVLFLMLMMMSEIDQWRAKTDAVSGGEAHRRWGLIARSVGQKFRAYFITRTVIGVLTALLYVGWLAIFGVDYLLLWGILTVLLNFVPTVGSIISGLLPVVFMALTRDPISAAWIGLGLLAIEQVMGNYLDPRIMGKQLAISPLVVLVSLLFWSLLWSMPGAFLAVPLTVLITMVLAHFDRFKPVALMLTDCNSLEELERYSNPDQG